MRKFIRLYDLFLFPYTIFTDDLFPRFLDPWQARRQNPVSVVAWTIRGSGFSSRWIISAS
jgi:hypothetical protein